MFTKIMSKFEETNLPSSVKLPDLDLDSTTLPTDIARKQDTEVNDEATPKQIAEDQTCSVSVASSGFTQELEKLEISTDASQVVAAKNLAQELDGDLKVWLN